jgi:hypothetical protein
MMGWWKRKQEEETDEEQRLVLHAASLHDVATKEVVEAVLDEDDDDAEFDDEFDADERGRRSHAGLWVTLAVTAGLFGLGIFLVMKFVNKVDDSGPAANSGVQAMEASIKPTPPGLPSLTGQYISFSYPQVFDSVKTLPNWPTTAERYSIGSTGDYRRSIQVMVENNTAQPTDDSGYEFRSNTPSQYKPHDVKVGTEVAVVMVKSDNTEQTIYWPHAGKLAVISVTSSNGTDDLNSFVSTITGSLKWVATS